MDSLTTAAIRHGLNAGTLLGPYRIDKEIGAGGMGAVYLATDTRLARRVALKVISAALGASPEAKVRFLQEARSAAALSHTNIASVYDVGESDGTPWLVMEYIEGFSLRTRITGPLDETVWLRYSAQIAAALEHAHHRRIVHRDIKPENVLIDRDEHVKVIDFGLAKAFHEADSSVTLTQPGAFPGTLAYAAPELITGSTASPRSDIYSLGVVLYEMACGAQPFSGLTGHALIAAILSGNYSPCRTRAANVPAWIADIIERCMSREPALRFRDGGELAAALREPHRTDSSPLNRPLPPSLAIIDFSYLGGAADLHWLGAGIAESLSADLAKIRSVRIISRSRVVQTMKELGIANNSAGSAVALGRSLGARWIVTGACQQIGSQIRVTAGLVDSGNGETLAIEKIDGNWSALFEVQDRVAAAILKALTISLGDTDEQKILPAETRDMAAYEHYVRARQQMYEMQENSLSIAKRNTPSGLLYKPHSVWAAGPKV